MLTILPSLVFFPIFKRNCLFSHSWLLRVPCPPRAHVYAAPAVAFTLFTKPCSVGCLQPPAQLPAHGWGFNDYLLNKMCFRVMSLHGGALVSPSPAWGHLSRHFCPTATSRHPVSTVLDAQSRLQSCPRTLARVCRVIHLGARMWRGTRHSDRALHEGVSASVTSLFVAQHFSRGPAVLGRGH